MSQLCINHIHYRRPLRPCVAVCIDGSDPSYLARYLSRGELPHIARFIREGFAGIARSSVPAFTCPNNMSIITGVPVSQHGISGNYYLDTKTWEPVVMTDPELLMAQTILSGFADAGARVVSITAKDKLRRQLQKDLDLTRGNISFSAEYADQCTIEENGIDNVLTYVGEPLPGKYSEALSLFVLQAGLKLLRDRRPEVMYLSLTDFVQHRYAPEAPEALSFYQKLDTLFGLLAAEDINLGLTADHGMSDMSLENLEPHVLWLQDNLDAKFGKGEAVVICPITDAFVAHHGALGGLVRVWSKGSVSTQELIETISALPEVDIAVDKERAVRMFELYPDREADVVVLAKEHVCIGTSRSKHDLKGLSGHRLRSHGSLHEMEVPFILNRPLNDAYKERAAAEALRNRHIFDYLINGTN